VGLLGPNGAGKTTTFYMIVGVIRPDSGFIFIDDQNITEHPMHRRAKAGIGYLAQERSIFRKLTVEQNLLAVMEMLKLSKGYALSGGESRRVEIARSLALDPIFILLDEPFAGVDPIAVLDIQQIIRHLTDRKIGVLITDHNVRETFGIIDHGYIMNEGELLVQGTPKELARNQQARKVYLGERFSM